MEEIVPKVAICVGAIVLRDNKILFVRQTYGNLAGKWSIPWGFAYTPGLHDQADPPHTAVIREIKEEAGVDAVIDGLLGIQNHQNPETGMQSLYLLFLCRHVGGEPVPDGCETDRAVYFSMKELSVKKDIVDDFCYWLANRVFEGRYKVISPEIENPYKPHLGFL